VQDLLGNIIPVESPSTNFIAFAHSCLTAAPDGSVPGLGETWVKGQDGALAYVGWTRSCWVDPNIAAYEDGFWCATAYFGRLGPAVSCHINRAGFQQFLSLVPLILYGDPEMPVWTDVPQQYTVTKIIFGAPDMPAPTAILAVQVSDGSNLLPGHTVTLLRGWQDSMTDPELWVTTTTDQDGTASFLVPVTGSGCSVTVTPPISPRQNFIPQVLGLSAQDLATA
jgi:hypothetical protein